MRRRFYAHGEFPINTIIIGVNAQFTSKAVLASTLSITEADIRRFEYVGDELHASIRKSYNILGVGTNGLFLNNPNIKAFIDLDGMCISMGQGAFSGSAIINAYLPAAIVGINSYLDATALTNELYAGEYISFANTFNGGGNFRNTRLKKITIPNIKIYQDSFQSSILLETVIGQPTQVGNNCFNSCVALKNIDVTKITSMAGSFTFYNTSVETLDFENLTDLNSISAVAQTFRLCKSKIIKLNKVANLSAKDNMFQSCSLIEIIEMKALKVFGNASLHPSTFTAIKLNCIIRVNIALATTNAGTADASLAWTKANRAAVIEFYNDFGNYVSTL